MTQSWLILAGMLIVASARLASCEIRNNSHYKCINIIMIKIFFFFFFFFFFFIRLAVSGSCVSIGYSTRCCPLSEGDAGCQATDGDCYCNTDCHYWGDCCEDVHCPAGDQLIYPIQCNEEYQVQLCTEPRTCADVGITQCCNDSSGTGHCDVHFKDSENNRCSCNASCHDRNDCCPDAHMFCRRKCNCIILLQRALARVCNTHSSSTNISFWI